ncbi:non-ribosomal peptide synthetase [Paucisalibacillus sp. EB02]|uniref:non-ribosomal peptide synthetase n=1 Tax=Paucisalibacillus sp. EB02 TaxID=1347087 RepID=UPI0005A935EC|nr:non-ribosomal peptide synthetase [Paucisalibacillus sp. EB02]
MDFNELHFEVPASYAQKRLWFIDQLNPDKPVYNVTFAFSLTNKLDILALEKSINKIVERHEILRTTFIQRDGEPFQSISPSISVPFNVEDCTFFSQSQKNDKLIDTLHGESRKSFDLETGPLIRTKLLKMDKEHFVLIIALHHIIFDGWSKEIFLNELSEFYNMYTEGLETEKSELPIQYADYSVWQHNWLQEENMDHQLTYWKEKLSGELPVLNLPLDYARPRVQSFEGAKKQIVLLKEVKDKLMHFSNQEGCTLFMTLLTAYKVFLYRITGQRDLLIGSPVANRSQKETEDLIGFFVNTLVFKTSIEENNTFKQLVRKVRETSVEAYQHQELPFEKLVEELQPNRDMGHSPLFQTMFVIENQSHSLLNLANIKSDAIPIDNGTSKFDLTLFVDINEETINLKFEYSLAIFKDETIAILLDSLKTLIEGIVENPNELIYKLPIVSEVYKEKQHNQWSNQIQIDQKAKCIHRLFEEQVMRTPHHVAVTYENERLTYQELNEKANQLAHYLIKQRVKKDTPVCVYMERSTDVIVAIIGILKAGGCYVFLDPDLPNKRLDMIIEDTRPALILTNNYTMIQNRIDFNSEVVLIDKEELTHETTENIKEADSLQQLAYVIYTSGSTGRPKGVAIEHSQLLNYCQGVSGKIDFHKDSNFAMLQSFAVDFGHTMLFPPLLNGGNIHIISKELIFEPNLLLDYLSEKEIDYLKITPTHYAALQNKENNIRLLPRKALIFGGEPLSRKLIQDLQLLDSSCTVFNHYGPSETTVGVLIYELTKEDIHNTSLHVPLGKPIPNTRVYILDEHLQQVPTGIPGQLYIAGDSVGRGYINNKDLTNQYFLSNPFEEHSRLYKTGDVVKYLHNGNIEFVGRNDRQVKIRGHRVELNEVTAVIRKHKQIKDVVIKTVGEQDKEIVAFLVIDQDNPLDISKLQHYYREILPEYMIPTRFIALEKLPLLSNGKVDIKSLEVPEESMEKNTSKTKPRNSTEQQIHELIKKLLDKNIIDIHDNFFELGGHSLLAIKFAYQLNETLEINIPVRWIFEYPTIFRLSHQIEKSKEILTKNNNLEMIPRVSRSIPQMLSYDQKRIWFMDNLEPNSSLYNEYLALSIKGSFEIDILEKSINRIIDRHEILRSTFEDKDGEPQLIIHENIRIDIDFVDLSNREGNVILDQLIIEEIDKPFDLQTGPLIRCKLIKVGELDYKLVIVIHHIIFDGWSINILLDELSIIYEEIQAKKELSLPELSIQYADYSNWQNNLFSEEKLSEKLGYWEKKLGGDLSVLNLPTDYPRPSLPSYRGSKKRLRLSKEFKNKLLEIGRKEEATPFMVMLTAFKVLLYRYTGQTDLLIGTPVANRSRREIENLIGLFVNTLVVRSDLTQEISFNELLRQVKETTLEALANQDLPFEKLVEQLQPNRDISHTPIFQTMFVYNKPTNSLQIGDAHSTPYKVNSKNAKFDLTLYVNEEDSGLDIILEYSTDLFKDETITRMVHHFQQLLISISDYPNDSIGTLSLLSKQERNKLVYEWNQTEVSIPNNACLHELIEKQVEQSPNAVAVRMGSNYITYYQLNKRANQLANYLRGLGVQTNMPVGVCQHRSIELVVSLLGIMKAGGAYVPLNVEGPESRNLSILEESGARICLINEDIRANNLADIKLVNIKEAKSELEKEDSGNLSLGQKSNSLVSVYFTSGSTGKPKGVANLHQGWVNRMLWMQQRYGLREGEAVLQKTTLTFDDSAVEFFWTLMFGGCIALMEPELHKDPKAILDSIIDNRASFVQFVPSMLTLFLDEISEENKDNLTCLREVISSGEALMPSVVEKYFSKLNVNLNNQWGVTEVSIDSTVYTVKPNQTFPKHVIPIGKPIANNTIYILDKRLQPVPVGVQGDIYIGGIGLADSYINNQEKTKESFIENPFVHSQKMYKTGDRGYFLTDGNIVLLGREDDQIKINGQRVEIGEIETTISSYEKVNNCAVVAVKKGSKYVLNTFYTLENRESIEGSITPITNHEFRTFLKDRLPGYMIPHHFILMEELPVGTSGKIDRKSLQRLENKHTEYNMDFIAPQSEIEAKAVQIWKDILEEEIVGVTDNFFELGGHSLDAVRANKRMNRELGINMPLIEFFRDPTIKSILDNALVWKEESLPQLSRVLEENKRYPLSHAQLRQWIQHKFDQQNALGFKYVAEINDEIDVEAMKLAFRELAKRHSTLRTIFEEHEGIPYQMIMNVIPNELEFYDLSSYMDEIKYAKFKNLLNEYLATPFDLAKGGLIKLRLYKLNEKQYVLVRRIHHIAWDGWSHNIMMRELEHYYQLFKVDKGLEMKSPFPYQYVDYSEWQNRLLLEGKLNHQKDYWINKLNGFNSPPRLSNDENLVFEKMEPQLLSLDSDETKTLNEISKKYGVTPYMTLLTVIKMWISKVTKETDITIGSPYAGRTQPELEEIVGILNNPVVLRTNLSGNPSFIEALQRVKETALNGQENQDFPFDIVIEELKKGNSLYNIIFIWQNASEAFPTLDGMRLNHFSLKDYLEGEDVLTELPEDPSVQYDLYIQVTSKTETKIKTYYNSTRFSSQTVERFLQEIYSTLKQVLENHQIRVNQIDLTEQVNLDAIF